MSAPIRWISVDDASTDITYVGDSWISDVGSLDNLGNNGPPFLSTLHGTNSSASFTFNYIGSSLRVMGTYTGSNSSIMSWTCFVDGVNLLQGGPVSGDFNQNQLMFCSIPTLPDGSHTVSVNATVGTNQTFWFDKIQYLPSATVSLENKLIQLDSNDSAITYGFGWDTGSHQTQTKNSQLGCNFIGVSVIWYGPAVSGNSTTATWTIDNNSPTTFTVPGLVANNSLVYNTKFFETPKYSMGSHKLIVTYEGDNSTTPLNFAYFVVQNGTLPNSTASANPSPTGVTSSSSQAAGQSSSSSHVAAIIGGTLGGIVLFLLIVLFLIIVRRRRNSRDNETRSAAVQSSFIHSPVHLPPLDDVASRSYQTNVNSPFPRKLQYVLGHTTAERFVASQDEQQHSRKPSDTSPSSSGGPSRFTVHADDGVCRELPQAARDAPPEYSLS